MTCLSYIAFAQTSGGLAKTASGVGKIIAVAAAKQSEVVIDHGEIKRIHGCHDHGLQSRSAVSQLRGLKPQAISVSFTIDTEETRDYQDCVKLKK